MANFFSFKSILVSATKFQYPTGPNKKSGNETEAVYEEDNGEVQEESLPFLGIRQLNAYKNQREHTPRISSGVVTGDQETFCPN